MAFDFRYDGLTGHELALRFGSAHVEAMGEVDSTMDVAHAMAEGGAPAGTIVLADRQLRGRGRSGKSWESGAGEGIWMTVVDRPGDAIALGVLSLRIGLEAARVLDRFLSDDSVRLKWPNDLMTSKGKLGGVLTEARWRAAHPEWVAIGIGINMTAPRDVAGAASLGAQVTRLEVLDALVPAVSRATNASGALTPNELGAFASRDWARGKRAVSPLSGTVRGITPEGALLVEYDGAVHSCSSGSLILEELSA